VRQWLITDPLGFEHVLLLNEGAFFGHENVAHQIDRETRDRVTSVILAALFRDDRLPPGYTRKDVLT